MAKRWPQLPQTTVSGGLVSEARSASARKRIATPLGFTTAALDADGSCDRLFVHRREARSAGLVVSPR